MVDVTSGLVGLCGYLITRELILTCQSVRPTEHPVYVAWRASSGRGRRVARVGGLDEQPACRWDRRRLDEGGHAGLPRWAASGQVIGPQRCCPLRLGAGGLHDGLA